MNAPLEIQRADGIAVLTIRREEKRNALHGPLWRLIRETAEALAKDPPRAVILTGSGGHFCAGMDLGFDNDLVGTLVPALQAKDAGALTGLIRDLKAVPSALTKIPCPVIAAVEGACAGGGLELALACDLRIAGKESFFSLPETRLGMVPDVGGTVRASRLLGRARASELVLTGRRIAPEQAEAWGLINRVVPKGEALAHARQLANEIAQNGPEATRAALGVLRRAPGIAEEAAFELETEAGLEALLSGECVEGLQAFLEKRAPRWAGQKTNEA